MGVDMRTQPIISLRYKLICTSYKCTPMFVDETEHVLRIETERLFGLWVDDYEISISPETVTVIFNAPVDIALVKIVNSFKSCTSRKMKACMNKTEIIPHPIWEKSYYLASLDASSREAEEMFVNRQKNSRRQYTRKIK